MCAPISEPFSTRQTDEFPPGRLADLHQPARSRETGRPATDDDDIEFHGLAFHSRKRSVDREIAAV